MNELALAAWMWNGLYHLLMYVFLAIGAVVAAAVAAWRWWKRNG